MTPLQTRLHTEVCLPAALTACPCGAYARVGEDYVRDRVAGYVKGIDDFCALANRTQARLDAARELAAKCSLEQLALWLRTRAAVWDPTDPPALVRLADDLDQLRAALSAGAGEK